MISNQQICRSMYLLRWGRCSRCTRFPTKREVAAGNQRRLERLAGATRTYKSHDTAGLDDRRDPVDIKIAVKLLNKEMAPETIKLKVRTISVSRG
jgi:hypothetical protein